MIEEPYSDCTVLDSPIALLQERSIAHQQPLEMNCAEARRPERVTDNYIAMQIQGRISESVQTAMRILHTEYGDHFSDVFKTITTDNGPEFEGSTQTEQWGLKGTYIRLGSGLSTSATTVCCVALSRIVAFSDELNGRPRRRLGYRTPEEPFLCLPGQRLCV